MAEHPILTAQITQDDSGVTLYCPELNIHTSGKSESQVRRKFVDALFDYYRFLEAHDFKNESPYKEHFAFLMGEVLPSLADASLRSPHRPRTLPHKVLELLRRRGDEWDADIFGSLVKQAAR